MSTEFDTEKLDAQQVPGNTPAPAAPTPRKRRPRSDAGKPRTPAAAKPGIMTLKIECSVAEGTDLLGYFIRTHRPDLAHQTIDALVKAQKAEA